MVHINVFSKETESFPARRCCWQISCFRTALATARVNSFIIGYYLPRLTSTIIHSRKAARNANSGKDAFGRGKSAFLKTAQADFVTLAEDCEDIDECELGYCGREATCINTAGSYTCDCPTGMKKASQAANTHAHARIKCNVNPTFKLLRIGKLLENHWHLLGKSSASFNAPHLRPFRTQTTFLYNNATFTTNLLSQRLSFEFFLIT